MKFAFVLCLLLAVSLATHFEDDRDDMDYDSADFSEMDAPADFSDSEIFGSDVYDSDSDEEMDFDNELPPVSVPVAEIAKQLALYEQYAADAVSWGKSVTKYKSLVSQIEQAQVTLRAYYAANPAAHTKILGQLRSYRTSLGVATRSVSEAKTMMQMYSRGVISSYETLELIGTAEATAARGTQAQKILRVIKTLDPATQAKLEGVVARVLGTGRAATAGSQVAKGASVASKGTKAVPPAAASRVARIWGASSRAGGFIMKVLGKLATVLFVAQIAMETAVHSFCAYTCSDVDNRDIACKYVFFGEGSGQATDKQCKRMYEEGTSEKACYQKYEEWSRRCRGGFGLKCWWDSGDECVKMVEECFSKKVRQTSCPKTGEKCRGECRPWARRELPGILTLGSTTSA